MYICFINRTDMRVVGDITEAIREQYLERPAVEGKKGPKVGQLGGVRGFEQAPP
jgi:hypothetical protein